MLGVRPVKIDLVARAYSKILLCSQDNRIDCRLFDLEKQSRIIILDALGNEGEGLAQNCDCLGASGFDHTNDAGCRRLYCADLTEQGFL